MELDRNPIIEWIKNRIDKNRNAIIVINGETGSGKTYGGIRLGIESAKRMGTNFSIKDNVEFNFGQLLRKMSLPHNKKGGTPFVFEEVGAVGGGASAMQWQSKANQFFNSFMQTCRHKKQVLIFTCPNFSNLDKKTRELTHMQIITEAINTKKMTSYFKVYRIQVNKRTGKMYFKFLRLTHKGKKFKFKRMELKCPPKDMCKEYERFKTRYTNKLIKNIMDEEKEEKKKGGGRVSKIDDKKLKKLIDKGLNGTEIARIFDVSTKTIQRHKKRLLEKTIS